jgi:hypothetical protein
MPAKKYYDANREKCIAATQVWKKANPEQARRNARLTAQRARLTEEGRVRVNEHTQRWAKKNRSKINAGRKAWLAKNPDYEKDWIAADRTKNPVRYIFRGAKNRAKALGIEFTIVHEDIVVPTHCPVLGIELRYSRGEKGFAASYSPSLDRFDNDKGYTKGNIRVISNRANLLKRDGTLDEFRKIVAYMERG